MPRLSRDYETRSTVDLKTAGAHKYAQDATTDVWCMAYAVDDGPVQLWKMGDPCPLEFIECACNPEWTASAHSDAFESAIERYIMGPRYGWPEIPLERHRCSMAAAYAMSLPGSLENAAAAVGLEVRKDMEGRKVMMQMAQPRRVEPDGTIVWWDDAARLEKLYAYCKQDVEVERALWGRIMPLSPAEQKVWELDQRINNRGLFVDLPAIAAAEKIIDLEKKRLDRSMALTTDGAVSACSQAAALTEWITSKGVAVSSLAKADLLDLLALPDLPTDVRRALELRREGAKTSLAKLKAMRLGAIGDGRMRGTLQYHGTSTGRWAGRRAQTTNLPRPEILSQDDIDHVFEILQQPEPPAAMARYLSNMYGPPMQVLADSVRGFITTPPGHDFIAADLAAIEARGIAWLAGQNDVLKVFAEGDADSTLPDIYCQAAKSLYGRPVTKKDKTERSVGKVVILSMGFGGGVGALAKMAKTYRVDMATIYPVVWARASQEQRAKAEEAADARLKNFPGMSREFFLASDIAKQFWRVNNPRTVQYWYDLEDAVVRAVEEDGKGIPVGAPGRETMFRKAGSFLWARLPSKRVLCYPYPELRKVKTPWGATRKQLTYMGVDSLSKAWQREHTYSGKLAENLTQSVCRDILVPALIALNAKGYFTPQHVYDEAVCEVPEGFGSVEEVERILSTPPEWATGFPIAAEGWRGKRYRK